MTRILRGLASLILVLAVISTTHADGLSRVAYNNPGLVVDLGVGLWAWPLPMDYDNDGDLDLVVSCPDKPNNSTYFFENPGGDPRFPIFEAPVKVGRGHDNIQVSYVDDQPRLLIPGRELLDFRGTEFEKVSPIYPAIKIHNTTGRTRANQWKYADHDGDGDLDLIVGVGDWTDYGWDDAYDAQGHWTRGPLHGFIYLITNSGDNTTPRYEPPVQLTAGGQPIDVFGRPSPNLADFDGDGDLDLLCGEFLDGFTYFENQGSRATPRYAPGRRLLDLKNRPVVMDLEMIVPVAIDWDHDGDHDLIVGDEDGRVAIVEHTGQVRDSLPRFLPPRYFQQKAADLKFGALITPCAADWDGDGDQDLVCGNSAGYFAWFENLDGANPPKWSAPKKLEADGQVIRIMAGPNGSIQGPCEAKWGYTVPDVADWDGDGDLDLLVNSIWGAIVWYENVGTSREPRLAASRPIEVEWEGDTPRPTWTWWKPTGKQLVTQWRTAARARDLTGDGLLDLIVLDTEGFLALFKQVRSPQGKQVLLPPKRIFEGDGPSAFDSGQVARNNTPGPLQLNTGRAGASGRRQWCFADWDGDGRLDLLVNSRNANWLQNKSSEPGRFVVEDQGLLDARILGGHATCPTTVDWNADGRPELLLGAEDGFLYHMPRSDP